MNEYPMKLLHSKYLKKVGKLSMIAISIICVFTIILFHYDYTNFNGFEKETSNSQKIMNRLYFTMTTFSSTGYGDVSPHSPEVRIITMILQFILVIAMLGGILEF
tara:strand:- start:381 stop:695 length:315 start_codon:yes stop_codon:yes gene_type:complete